MTARKLTLMAMLTAIALIVFMIEALVPLPLPIPGAKLGLANAVTLFALFYSKPAGPSQKDAHASRDRAVPSLSMLDAFMMLLCRIMLGAALTGRIVAFIYSLSGGMLGFAAQAGLKRFVTEKQIWVCGAVGAIFHNIGQILAAMLVTGTPAIAAYLPPLIIAGIFTGIVTGLAAQLTIARLRITDNASIQDR